MKLKQEQHKIDLGECFNWCDGGRRNGIDPKDRVSSGALEEEEKKGNWN